MSKKADQLLVAKLIREGFVLPEKVEQFFIDAKARAVKSMLEGRENAKRRIKDIEENGADMYAKLSEAAKTFLSERYIRGEGWKRVPTVLTLEEWKYNMTKKIRTNDYPFYGYSDEKAIKIVEEDCDIKRIKFIIRVYNIVGEKITGSELIIDSRSGDVNGLIWSDKGKAKVQTIGAGGYNIQCYHFRCLVHEVRR